MAWDRLASTPLNDIRIKRLFFPLDDDDDDYFCPMLHMGLEMATVAKTKYGGVTVAGY